MTPAELKVETVPSLIPASVQARGETSRALDAIRDRRVLAIVGASGTGKTWLGTRLAPALGIPRLAIDDFGDAASGRWLELLSAIEETEGKVLVESCATPPAYRALIGITVHLSAKPAVRSRHLRERGEPREEIRRLVAGADRTPRAGDINLRGELTGDHLSQLVAKLTDLGWAADVGGDPQSGDMDTAPPAGKKVYGFGHSSREG